MWQERESLMGARPHISTPAGGMPPTGNGGDVPPSARKHCPEIARGAITLLLEPSPPRVRHRNSL